MVETFAETGLPDGLYVLDCRSEGHETQADVRKAGVELLGGGPGFTCTGNMAAIGVRVTLHLEVHQTGPEAQPVFGPEEDITFELVGSIFADSARLHGESVQEPRRPLELAVRSVS